MFDSIGGIIRRTHNAVMTLFVELLVWYTIPPRSLIHVSKKVWLA